ncbi:MAG: sulfurtransferase-like selenium metabolism protein YedF [Desulfobacter sp.]|nr:sulfurtransferase-like selenium metabolism protein YedF [Desulfobacter sp.]WDP85047.1 MAG: sulfurtransferase-like selenium metabolism protein YedF [Desulfobacter sp.]
MKKEIDCRNMDCPAPVLETKNCIETEKGLTQIRVIVDNDAAVENVSRFLSYNGFEVGVNSDGRSSTVQGLRDEAHGDISQANQSSGPALTGEDNPDPAQRIMVMISADTLGKEDDELGRKLMINFIKTLKEMGEDLWRLVFVNCGVKLAIEESAVIEELKAFEADGITILVCGTCLTHLSLMEKKAVGQTTNMLDIVTAMQLADKVVNL